MAKITQNFSRKIINFFASKRFFWLMVVLLVVQATWVALTARYPQAFDEQYHVGISRLFFGQALPFFSSQPAGAEQFGALIFAPLVLYHYLLSYPYELIASFVDSFTTQIIILRFINIGLFVWGLILARKLLSFVASSQALVNVCLLFFGLIPVVPQLAGQISYDNLLFPLTVWSLILFVEFYNQWALNGDVQLRKAAALLTVGAVASLVKYSYLPIFAVIVVFVLYVAVKLRKDLTRKLQKINFANFSLGTIFLTILLLASLSLFTFVYGQNMLKYHSPVPSCSKVLGVERCQAFPPFRRNYYYLQQKVNDPNYLEVFSFAHTWSDQTIRELVFTISSWYDDTGEVTYHTASPLPVMNVVAWSALYSGLALALIYAKRIWARPVNRILLIVILAYVLALFAKNFESYITFGRPNSIHGRYLLPLMPMIFVLIASAWHDFIYDVASCWFKSSYKENALVLVTAFTILALTQGGGVLTYIYRSNDDWSWQQSALAQTANSKAQNFLDKVFVVK